MAVEIAIPALGESVSEAVIARWAVEDGAFVEVDAIVVELETDKSMMEILAETSGVVRIGVAAGENVTVGQVIGEIDPGAKAAAGSATAAKVAEPVPVTPSAPAKVDTQEVVAGRDGPAATKLMREAGIAATDISGTGKDGRITKGDVLAVSAGRPDAPAKTDSATARQEPDFEKPIAPKSDGSATERVPMSLLRRKIAERLLSSQHTTASLTTFNEIDMSAVMAMRSAHKEDFEKRHGVRLGFMSFFSRAAVLALRDVSAVNAFIDGTDIVYNRGIHLGIAVGTPRGLVVPVVRDAQNLSFAELEAEIGRLGKKGRDGKIAPDDLIGGTFTISNGGVYGSLLSTPILNPPQSGILGLHKIEDRAVVVDGAIVVRPMMYVALTYDHRIVDGEQAVTFLVKIKQRMEDPARMLLEV